MTAPAPGDQARYSLGGVIRTDATLGPVVDWQTASGGSGTVQLAQLPPPTDIQPASQARDAIVVGNGLGVEPPIGSVLMRQTPRMIAFRTPAGWFGQTASGNAFGPGGWADVPAGNWRIIWLGTGT